MGPIDEGPINSAQVVLASAVNLHIFFASIDGSR